MRVLHLSLAAVAVCLLSLATVARADISFTLGNVPQSGEQSVVLTNGQMGTTVYAATSVTGTLVQFSSNTDLL